MRGLFDTLPAWRRPVLVALALVTLALVSRIPSLEAEFEPEALVPAEPGEAEREAAAFDGFPRDPDPVVVLVEARDVLDAAPLGFVHALSRAFEGREWVARVESLVSTPLPRAAEVDDGITLDALDGDEGAGERASAPELERALGAVVASDPGRFPMGLGSLSGPLILAPLVGEVPTEADRRRVVAAVERNPALERRLIAPDRAATLVAIVPRAPLDAEQSAAVVEELEAWLASHPPPGGVEVRVGGMPAVRDSMREALREDQLSLVGLAILGSLIVLAIGFRSWAGVILPLGAAGMTSGMMVGAMALLGEPLNLLNNVVPPLLITIGLGDAVHLVVRYREELRRDPGRMDAARRTMRAMVAACFLTSLTTAVGFLSLVVSDTEVMRRFGITAAAGVMLAYGVTVLFLPAALPDFAVKPVPEGRRPFLDREISEVAAFATRHAGAVIVASVALVAASLALGTQVRVDSALLDQLDPESEARVTAARLEEDLSGVRVLEVGLRGEPGVFRGAAGLREASRLERWLGAQPEVLVVDGPASRAEALFGWLRADAAAAAGESPEGEGVAPGALDDDARAEALAELALRAAPDRWAQVVDTEAGRARIEVRLRDVGERAINRLVDRVEERFEGAVVGGEAQRSARGLERLVDDLTLSLGLAVVVIFAMLAALLRSARLGAISVLPNVLPLALTVAYMTLRDIPLHASTAIVFTVSIGLVVDGTIHVLARYREEIHAGRAREAAIEAAMRGSGRAVVLGALTLLIGFVALSFATFIPIRLFAELSIVAIATSLIGELLVLPALLKRFG